MFFTTKQKFILETLKSLGCVERRQLHVLMRGHFQEADFEITQASMDAMLRQIRVGTADVRLDGELVWLSGQEAEPRRLEAIDVMIELTEGRARDFSVKEKPCLLRFSFGEGSGLKLFTVVSMDAPPPELPERSGKERTIWISDSGEIPKGLSLPARHFFAARLPDGSHRFYGSNGP